MSQTRPIDEHSMHTRTCGELRFENVGEEVTLTGWVSRRRDHGGLIFCDLRDREGITQLTFDPEHSDGDAFKIAETMRPEWPIKIHGVVRARGEETTNTKLATGEIEVLTDHAEVLNTPVTPPFQIEDGIETSEDTRLRYRYLDLRRPEMMANLKLRSDFTFAIREALHNREFMEVETPSLFKSTPEGARDFIVPSRIQPGNFYALPQSPQLLKQLLMVGGVERYYQVAKCFRDEDLRADRQPEFTQVDIEMSFVDQNDVMSALEEVLADAFGRMGVEMPTPLRRMNYWEAMDTYGSDKPDTRYGMHLVDLTDIFANSKFKVFATAANEEGSVVKAINAKGAGAWARAKIDKLAGVASTFGAKGLAWIAFREDGSINSPIVKFFSDEEMAALRERMNVEPGDLVMFAAGPRLLSWAACVPTWLTRSRSSARATTSCGSSTSRCSTGMRTARPMQLSTSPLPCRPRPTSPRSRPTRWQPVRAPTTLSWTALRPAAAVCVSTTPRCRCPCSSSWALLRSVPSLSLASSWRRSSLVRPRWAVLLWAWTACACCSPVPTPSATSWRSPRRPAAPTSCRALRVPFLAPSSRTSACA